ncbi:hypothetical protein [Ilumatobacter sp.]
MTKLSNLSTAATPDDESLGAIDWVALRLDHAALLCWDIESR